MYAAKLKKEKGIAAANQEGVLLWTHEGTALVDADGTAVKRVHTYGAAWSHAAAGWEVIVFPKPWFAWLSQTVRAWFAW